MTKVSVVVPVYNTEKYLKRCLNSLVSQTLNDIEVIVIDDCSTDSSSKILDEYQNNYSNFKVIHNKSNMGIGYNRNLGVDLSNGEYISFIDSDDWVDTSMYEKMYQKAKEEELDLVICNFHKMLQNENEPIEVISDYIIPSFESTNLEASPELLLNVNLAPWNKLYKKELIKENRFPIKLKYEDALFVAKAMADANKIGIVNEKLNYYLVRSESETTTMDERVFDIVEVTKKIVEELKIKSYYEDIKEYVEAWVITNLFRYTIQQKYQKNKTVKNSFIDVVFNYLNENFPKWRKNKIWKNRNLLKRTIESNKSLTKIYCTLFNK